jgi:uncharacterized protein YcgI (DUF1989 family)
MGERITIPARRGIAALLHKGQAVRIINTHGGQVVDAWAFVAGLVTEYMGMEQSRASWTRLFARIGESFVTNRRRPILTLIEDTSPGRHDTLIAPCDNERYALLGCSGYHDNCRDNLHAALAGIGVQIGHTPASLNLFMNIPWTEDGSLAWGKPLSKPGDYLVLRAELDCILALSACPQDLLPTNNLAPTEAHFEILD